VSSLEARPVLLSGVVAGAIKTSNPLPCVLLILVISREAGLVTQRKKRSSSGRDGESEVVKVKLTPAAQGGRTSVVTGPSLLEGTLLESWSHLLWLPRG
jgi:hypothetical protein